jgi:hypothetical protein
MLGAKGKWKILFERLHVIVAVSDSGAGQKAVLGCAWYWKRESISTLSAAV